MFYTLVIYKPKTRRLLNLIEQTVFFFFTKLAHWADSVHGYLDIFMCPLGRLQSPDKKNIGATTRIGQEIWGLPYARFVLFSL